MWVLINQNAPKAAKLALKAYGKLIEFASNGIAYPGVSGHVDVFMAQLPDGSLVIAPNTPLEFQRHFIMNQIPFVIGKKKVKDHYPHTAHYNAVITPTHIIHHIKHTDSILSEHCSKLISIHVHQGYSACNVIALPGNIFLTGDNGIFNTLLEKGLNAHFINDKDVVLKRFNHGFWGGAVGIYQNKLFVCGNLAYHSAGEKIRHIAKEANVEIVELFDGIVNDVGGIRFIDETLSKIDNRSGN